MDYSFQSSLFNSAQKGNGSRFQSPLYGKKTSQSGKSLGRYSLSGKSNASSAQFITRSESNIVECYGLPLPVQINETLTFSERNAVLSVNYSSNGWAWAVHGRKLYVWQYKDTKLGPQRRTIASQCRILTLPHCDIGHKASLITVYTAEGHISSTISCLAVSPTGDIRYWPSISHDGSSIDENGILEGQEFDELVSISPLGYMLVTTTCTLVALQILIQNGRQTIQHRTIKPPSGFFGGFSKKFASILIGVHNNQDKESKFIKIAAEHIKKQSEWYLTVLADKSLQRWVLNAGGMETFLFEDIEICKKIRDTFHQKIWSNRDGSEIEVWSLDMQPIDNGVVILSAAVNLSHTPQIHYALVTFNFENNTLKLVDVNIIKYKGFYTDESKAESLNMKFIINKNLTYVYNTKTIFPILMNDFANTEVEKIEFHAQEDKILAAACCNNIPLFFSKLHGFVSVAPSDFDPEFMNSSDIFNQSIGVGLDNSQFMNESIVSMNTTQIGNLTMYDLDPNEIYNASNDLVSKLKAAFVYHLKRNTVKCKELLRNLMLEVEQEGVIDNIVIKISQELVEDVPAADPRWENVQQHALGSSSSMQIIQQLREKNLAFSYFIDFLHIHHLWNNFTTATFNGKMRPTCQVLSDINEKIVVAIALKSLHNNHSRIMDEAIDLVLKDSNIEISSNLTNQDVFYVKILQIHQIFKAFITLIEDYVANELATDQIQLCLIEINTIVLTVMNEVFKFRDSKSAQYDIINEQRNDFEYSPWTASSKYGIHDVFYKLIYITLQQGIKSTGEPEFVHKHYHQMTELIDIYLDGKKKHAESIKDQRRKKDAVSKYEFKKSELIYILVENSQYELATKLAEKYHDFKTLLMICDNTKNQERLDEYNIRFGDMNFSQFAINWHIENNKQGIMFDRFKNNQPALTQYLSEHPSLAWVQLLFNGEFSRAAETLFQLAQNETAVCSRKRTMLSLSKLSALTGQMDMSELIAEIDSELMLIAHQAELPPEGLLAYGYDPANPRVLAAEEMIEFYISNTNSKSVDEDFRKALELLTYVENKAEMKMKIWCTAILKDTWTNYDLNSPNECLENMLFFKLLSLCCFYDKEDTFVLPIESFQNAPELGDFAYNKSFQFLLKYGYEHIAQTCKIGD